MSKKRFTKEDVIDKLFSTSDDWKIPSILSKIHPILPIFPVCEEYIWGCFPLDVENCNAVNEASLC
jgi:hypothetical protein